MKSKLSLNLSRSRRSKSSKGGSLFLGLFALPFAGVGVGVGIWMVLTIVDYMAMRSWQATPATVHTIEVKSSRGSDSTTYKAVGRYSYTVNGQHYTSERVSLSKGSDNVGSYHHDLVDRVRADMNANRLVCYYDTAAPSEAILDRGLRVSMVIFKSIFMLVFGGVGFGLIFAAIYGRKKEKEEEELAQEHPEAPWLQKAEWQHARIECDSKHGVWGIAIFALIWNAISWPVVFFAMDDIFGKGWANPALIALLFPAVGLLMIVLTLVEVVRKLKFGKVYFEMKPMPGILGGPVSGMVHIPRHIDCEKGFRTALKLIHRYTTGSGKNRSTREDVKWEDVRVIAKELAPRDKSKTIIPILFAPPFDQKESKTQSGDGYLWRLAVEADIPGLDLNAKFEVPVFRTEESHADYQLDESKIKPFEGEREAHDILADNGVELLRSGNGLCVSVPPMRRVGSVLGLGIFTTIWTGICIGLWVSSAPILFPIVFSFFGLLIGYGFLDMALYASRITIRDDRWTLKQGWLWLGKTYTFTRDELSEIKESSNMQSGNTRFYTIAATIDGKPTKLAKYITPLEVAKELRDVLQKEAGPSSS